MEFTFVFWGYLVINLMLSGLVAYVAAEKGRDAFAFFGISFLFSFLVGILVVLAVPNKAKALLPNSGTRSELYGLEEYFDCPACAEQVKLAAKICKYCGTSVEDAAKELLRAARVEHERTLKLQEAATKTALDALLERRADSRSRFETLIRSKVSRVVLILSALVGLGALIWTLINPPAPTQWQLKTSVAPTSTLELTSNWLRALESCGFSATYGEASSGRIFEVESGKVLWSIFKSSDSVSLDIDIWNSDRVKIECVSKEIFGTTLASVTEASPRQFSNGFSQGVEASTSFEGEGQASGYYFRWSQ